MTSTELVTLIIALVGAVLGVINTSYSIFKDKVRIKVIPKVADHYPNPNNRPPFLCIDVTNLGLLPVTIREVGFKIKDSSKRIMLLQNPMNQQQLPYRLEPRSSITLYSTDEETYSVAVQNGYNAYAYTDCGRQYYGKSRALKDVIKAGKEMVTRK